MPKLNMEFPCLTLGSTAISIEESGAEVPEDFILKKGYISLMIMAASDVASLTTIDDLPDECLREVMLRIPIQNRINLRKVCSKWCVIIDNCWSAVKKLECIEPTEEKHGIWVCHDSLIIATLSRKMYEETMKHCGVFLTHLEDRRKEPSISILQFAVKYCFNIKQLNITVSSKADDKHMNQLLTVNPKMRNVRVKIEFKNAKMCLRNISIDHLEELMIDLGGLGVFPPSILMSQKQIVRRANSLNKLHSYFVDDELMDLIRQKVELKALAVMYCAKYSKNMFHSILELKNLQELSIITFAKIMIGRVQIQRLPMTDNFLISLTHNLQLLESLNLDASNITDRGFMHLASLPKLSELTLTYCQGVTDEFLYLFSGLKRLSVNGCKICDEGVIKLLRKTQTMQYLGLAITLITNKTLIAAIEEMNKRDNGIPLKINVSATAATPLKIKKFSPLLEILF